MIGFHKTRERLRRNEILALDLEEARQDFLWGRNLEAYYRLMEVMEAVVVEPLPNSEEYKDGERKPTTSENEPEQEEETEVVSSGPEEIERDEDGYLIR